MVPGRPNRAPVCRPRLPSPTRPQPYPRVATPLHHAVRAGRTDLVGLLLDMGADPTVVNGGYPAGRPVRRLRPQRRSLGSQLGGSSLAGMHS